ncbi:MAG TPA: hypothetical protein VK919_00725 [Solirubrobacterales bacterium]|nr:hypothetical protein [Solirubrobacterales bacterium]
MFSGGRIRTDLGRRVELVPMDRHYGEISIGLYVRDTPEGPVATVHSYSGKQGVGERLESVAAALTSLGGLEPLENPLELRFPCGTWHAAAAKRLFVEACKQDPSASVEPRPLRGTDSRSGQVIVVEPLGDGAYEVQSDGATDETPSRAPAIARAIAKLAELSLAEGDHPVVSFPCGQPHDPLIGLLLVRAQNLRQILREEELEASRGVLAAPSQQEGSQP